MGLLFGGIEQVDILAALCRAYNNWASDFCSTAPDRLLAPVLVPQRDVEESLVEVRRAMGKPGIRGVFLRPNPINGRTLDDPAWEPLWSLLEESDSPLVVHEGTAQNLPQTGLDRYDNFLFRHMISHPVEQMMALLSLICGRVLERHPRLRVVIVEAGCGWVPYWIERMDHHMEEWGHASAPLQLLPSEYFKRQCYVSADAEEEMIPAVVSCIGDENILFSTDYPHPDHPFKGITERLSTRPDLSEESKARILGGNAARAFCL
jgi:predicted TIM-barrel fold metal-dependent hydrolase